ncbi:hypothetical protein RHMOL_Rhmol07G0261000 [Rhododendron molle]|uniref:Uncharacterized protein n=1 Tax=Rhododendron molle TaxID=49168 RepID=A0ACC0N4M0_RHOML|nr:hypothetical protein RHMOL_Rhmol07G0261000 [Rhododendron molle]
MAKDNNALIVDLSPQNLQITNHHSRMHHHPFLPHLTSHHTHRLTSGPIPSLSLSLSRKPPRDLIPKTDGEDEDPVMAKVRRQTYPTPVMICFRILCSRYYCVKKNEKNMASSVSRRCSAAVKYRSCLGVGVDERCFTNGYLDTVIDFVPAMKGIRLQDFPNFARTTNLEDVVFKFTINTIDGLEREALDAFSSMFPPVYAIGPLQLLEEKQIPKIRELENIGLNMWTQDLDCLTWLDKKESSSVTYVNFGCVARMTSKELFGFGWGLANGKQKKIVGNQTQFGVGWNLRLENGNKWLHQNGCPPSSR